MKGTQTIGELDFLVYNTTEQRIEHWEVALKYYLGEKDLSLPYWYGLNREDTLLKNWLISLNANFNLRRRWVIALISALPYSKVSYIVHNTCNTPSSLSG